MHDLDQKEEDVISKAYLPERGTPRNTRLSISHGRDYYFPVWSRWILVFLFMFAMTDNFLATESDERIGIWRAATNDVYIEISGDDVNYYETTKGNRDSVSRSTCIQIRSDRERALTS